MSFLPGWQRRPVARCPLLTLLAVVALQLSSAATQLEAGAPQAMPAAGSPATTTAGGGSAAVPPPPSLWQRWESLFPRDQLRPMLTEMHGHQVVYQVPDNPRATLFIAHGCNHRAHDWWPRSDACPICLGLPEEVAQTQQALARNYAVVAMSAYDPKGEMCMSWVENHEDGARILTDFLQQHKLEHLPVYGVGVSVGGGFVTRLPTLVKMHGVLSEVLGPLPGPWDLDAYKLGIPPMVFVAMDRDHSMAERISTDARMLRARGAPTVTIRVPPRPVHPTFFSDRSPDVTPELSAKVVTALREIGMLDDNFMVTKDPRHAKPPWVPQLLERVPELSSDGGVAADHSQVWEEMNLAWSQHEIIADFATAAFIWFESGGKADFSELLREHAPAASGFVGDPADSIPPPPPPPLPPGPSVAPVSGGAGDSQSQQPEQQQLLLQKEQIQEEQAQDQQQVDYEQDQVAEEQQAADVASAGGQAALQPGEQQSQQAMQQAAEEQKEQALQQTVEEELLQPQSEVQQQADPVTDKQQVQAPADEQQAPADEQQAPADEQQAPADEQQAQQVPEHSGQDVTAEQQYEQEQEQQLEPQAEEGGNQQLSVVGQAEAEAGRVAAAGIASSPAADGLPQPAAAAIQLDGTSNAESTGGNPSAAPAAATGTGTDGGGMARAIVIGTVGGLLAVVLSVLLVRFFRRPAGFAALPMADTSGIHMKGPETADCAATGGHKTYEICIHTA